MALFFHSPRPYYIQGVISASTIITSEGRYSHTHFQSDLYVTLVLNPFQIVTSVLHKKVKGASSHLTIKKAGQKHQTETHG